MATKDWKKTKVDKWRTLWTKGDEKFGDYVIVDKTPGAINRYTTDKYSVSARRKINEQTMNGHFRFYKTRAGAVGFAKAYMKKH